MAYYGGQMYEDTDRDGFLCVACGAANYMQTNKDEYTITICQYCNSIARVMPLYPIHPYSVESAQRFDDIYRLSEQDIHSMMELAVELNEKDWFEELGRMKKQLLHKNDFYVSASNKIGNYYESDFHGIHWDSQKAAWKSTIKHPTTGKNTHLGYFHTEREAAIAHDVKAIEYMRLGQIYDLYVLPKPKPRAKRTTTGTAKSKVAKSKSET